MLLNKKFPFRSFGGQEPSAEEVRADLEDFADSVLSEQTSISGRSGRGRPRYFPVSNPLDTNPNGRNSGGTVDVFIPPATSGTRTAEGGVYYFRSNGRKVFYQTEAPSEGTENDVWYDVDDDYKLYIYQNGVWEPVFERVPDVLPTLSLEGGLIDHRTYLAELERRTAELLEREAGINASIQHSSQETGAYIRRAERIAADATSAVAENLLVLSAQVNDPTTGLPAATARIAQVERVTVDAIGSLAETVSILDAAVRTTGSEAIQTNARVIREETARATADSAIASSVTILDAQVNDPSTGLPASHARITTEETARANSDGSAIASIVTALTAGSGGATVTGGTVVIGLTYKITSVGSGIIVTNIGAPNNNLNTTFVATGTTPTAWNGGSLQETRLASIETWAVAKTAADSSLAAEYVLNVVTGGTSGRRVAGFRITNQGGAGGATDFVVQTDKFTIVDTSGNIPTVPFEVTAGVVYIKEAVIKEVTAGKITAGTITAAVEMTAATITTPIIRSGGATTFAAVTGFYLGVDSGTPKFRIGDPAGSRLSWDGTTLTVVTSSATITGGSVTIGSGDSTVRIGVTGVAATTGLAVGDVGTGHYIQIAAGGAAGRATLYVRKSDGTVKGFFDYDGTSTVLAGGGGANDVIQSFQKVNVQEVHALSSGDTDDSSTALTSVGGCYIGGKFRSVGIANFNTTVNIAGVLNANSNVDVAGYLAVDGVCYGKSGTATGVAFAPRQDDVDSGMYSDEANKVKFAAGGSECFRIVNASSTLYAIVTSGAIFRIGSAKTAITTETVTDYVTAQDNGGNTIKLAIVS